MLIAFSFYVDAEENIDIKNCFNDGTFIRMFFKSIKIKVKKSLVYIFDQGLINYC